MVTEFTGARTKTLAWNNWQSKRSFVSSRWAKFSNLYA